jgi:hypothetical protein
VVFYISIPHDRRALRLKVELVYADDRIEKFIVSGRNKSLALQSNRPLLRSKGLRSRKPNWKVIEGHMQNTYILEAIIREIEAFLKEKT